MIKLYTGYSLKNALDICPYTFVGNREEARESKFQVVKFHWEISLEISDPFLLDDEISLDFTLFVRKHEPV